MAKLSNEEILTISVAFVRAVRRGDYLSYYYDLQTKQVLHAQDANENCMQLAQFFTSDISRYDPRVDWEADAALPWSEIEELATTKANRADMLAEVAANNQYYAYLWDKIANARWHEAVDNALNDFKIGFTI